MKIFPVSDMHLEFHHQSLPPYCGMADVVVRAGDIHTKGQVNYWISGHSHCAQHFQIGQTEVCQNCLGYPM